MIDWNAILRNGFFKRPGEHALVVGATGTGKTQCLYYLLGGLRTHAPKERIVWFDTGKSSEILGLAEQYPVMVHSPDGTTVEIKSKHPVITAPDRILQKQFAHPTELWDNMVPDRINVVSVEPFFPDPKHYSQEITEIFRILILKARAYGFEDAGMIPMAIFMDEIQWVVPSERTALNRQHNEGAKWFQRNIELLRSMDMRIVASTQGWTKLRAGARDSFGWLFIKRGAHFSFTDRPSLAKWNRLFARLPDAGMRIVMPDQTYSKDIIITEFYGDAKRLGTIKYKEVTTEKTT
jgi:hypothetical protein